MNKILVVIFLTLMCFEISPAQITYNNNWETVGGNNNRNCFSNNFYEFNFGFDGSYNAPASIWGMPIFTYNSNFATTRYTSLSPLRALIAAFQFGNPNPIWTYGENSGVNIIMGFKDNVVYVRDFQQNGNDTIFALNSGTGGLLWKSRFTVERGIIWTAVFAPNGDLILPGSGSKRIMRINHLNGDTVWTNSRIIPNTGAECFCINGNTLYAWQGGITTPKTMLAIDVATGVTKYSSAELPGDGDQEIPFSVSLNGILYCIRDGGLMYALKDNGSGFEIRWSRTIPQPVGTYTQIAVGADSTVYVPFGKKIYRLNQQTGAAMDSSTALVSSGNINPRFATGKTQLIYVGNGADNPSEGKFFLFSKDLQTIHWEIPYPYNYYCGPSFGNDESTPTVLMTGAGTDIKTKYTFVDKIIFNNENVPLSAELSQNYPNPFNPKTNFTFSIHENGFVSLKLYDVLGNEMQTFIDGMVNAGEYRVEFDGTNYASGIYFYKLSTGNFIKTRKMNLIK